MSKIKTIRSIERAMQVLRYLEHHSPASLEDVHGGTRLPRATVARVLLTLLNEGMVRRGFADSLYRISARLPQLGREVRARDRLAEAAALHMNELCDRIGWPSDLMVRRGIFMEIAESTRLLSPFFVQRMLTSETVTLPATAIGQAYLAFCPADELAEIRRALAEVDFAIENFYGGETAFQSEMEKIRRRGYADRHPTQRGQTSLTVANYDDGLSAIAVPLIKSKHVHGCLNLLWNRKASSVEDMADRHLDDLQATAENIMASFEAD